MSDVLWVVVNAASSFVTLFIISKLLGKKQIAELDFIDYVIGISIGSIAAEWSTDAEHPWYFYVIAMTMFFVFSLAITYFERKAPIIKAFLRGRPIVIIEDGKINYKNLKKSKLDVNDVMGVCRVQGYFDLNNVAFAIFETSGDISILPKSSEKPVVISDIDKKAEKSELTKYVIIDGKVDENCLKSYGKDKKWLYSEMNITSKKQLNNVILAEYDEKNDDFIVHYKNG